MGRSVQQIFRDLAEKGFDARVRHIAASYRFDIESAGSFRVEIDHGKLSARQDTHPADCVVACSAEDFVRIADGAQNMLTAYMQGRVRIDGDIALAKLLHGLLPPPPPRTPGARP
jgi:putative sterol carrier protein